MTHMAIYKKRTLQKILKNPNQIYNSNSPITFNLKYNNVMKSCREIMSKESSGSGFIYEYKNRIFLITVEKNTHLMLKSFIIIVKHLIYVLLNYPMITAVMHHSHIDMGQLK